MSEAPISLDEIWAEAARQFHDICGESLQRGDVKSFDDVRRKIENVSKQPYGASDDQEDKWDKAKGVGLQSLKYMKMLLGAASQAATFIPVPSAAANIAGSSLSFVFDIPEKIKGYNEAVDRVFTDVSSALSQFQIYKSIDDMNQPLLVQQIHLVMASVVKICAHVVKYRQGRRRDRFMRQLASIFDDNKPLEAEMNEFRRLVQAQRDVEGTVSLSVLVETRAGVVQLLESFAVFGKTVEETHQGVQALKDDNDRINTLIKIRNTLQVPTIVLLDTRTTQTCTNIAAKCLPGTGSWIWADNAFVSWTEGTAKGDDSNVTSVLIISGPPSSGKTMATAQIVKRLEEEKGRTYVAHYFFLPASSKKGEEDNKYPIHSALRYMAFQIARVDPAVRKALGKACDSGSTSVLSRNSSSNLNSLWSELKIGAPGSGATYYLAFDGLENLDEKEREMLLDFVFNPKLAENSAGRVRVLVSGTDKVFQNRSVGRNAVQIDMEQYNGSDMRLVIEDRIAKQNLLRNAKPGSVQQKARDNVLQKLPQKAAGSYSQLQFALEEVLRLLGSRTSSEELERVLDQPMNSHETAIKALQRSLTLEEIGELNELLKWVHFSNERMTVAELEDAMFLYSGTESIGSLQDIVTSKYLAVLKIDYIQQTAYVEGQDGALEYLQKAKDHKAQHSKDQPTISMTINISNADQEIVGHFLWDLAQKAIRDQFRFNFDAASNTLHTSQSTIAVDEFEANHTIAMRAFQYLSGEPRNETKAIGRYLLCWLPYHLAQITQLDYEEKGSLKPDEQIEIGHHLYHLFKDQDLFKRHRAIVEELIWTAEEMEDVQKWLMNSAVVRRLPRQWRDEVQRAASPVRGYFRPFVKIIIETWLRSPERLNAESRWNYRQWVRAFMEVDDKTTTIPRTPNIDTTRTGSSPDPATSETAEVDWDRLSTWCQNFLELPDSELDSLWWDRIAQVAAIESKENPELVMSLFKRALEKDNPSWVCNLNLAECLCQLERIPEAIAELELALKTAERGESTPSPEESDLMWLHSRLGDFHLLINSVEQAAEQYLIVTRSSDVYLADAGQVAYMKAKLSSDDADGAKEMLQSILAKDGSEGSMVRVLKLIARDAAHSSTISNIFKIAKENIDLLNGVVRAIEKATAPLEPGEDQTVEMSEDDRFAEDESRGVLLYHRGMVEAYGLSSQGTGSVKGALTFWHECREQLYAIGGPVASTTRTNANTELAKYYFQSLLRDKGPPEHIQELTKLAEEDSGIEGNDAIGYLTAVYALRDDKEKARALLSRRIKVALQVLSDDQPENDYLGHLALFKSLAHCQDFDNAAAVMTLMGTPDLVTNSLHFKASDLHDGSQKDNEEILTQLQEMGKRIVAAMKVQVPDSSQQTLRIEVAKELVDGIVPTDLHKAGSTALTLLRNRITALQETHRSTMETMLSRYDLLCNGLGPPGTICDKEAGFDYEFYHCIYCSNCDFCPNCFQTLRQGSNPSMQCSAEHAWIKVPRKGSDFYCGFEAKIIRKPVVRLVEGDDRVLEAIDDGSEGIEELTLEAWKLALAKEWEISLED